MSMNHKNAAFPKTSPYNVSVPLEPLAAGKNKCGKPS